MRKAKFSNYPSDAVKVVKINKFLLKQVWLCSPIRISKSNKAI
jgi:hypothetical protein